MSKATKLAIRMARQGCANRPFYHIQVMSLRAGQHDPPIEQLGVYDPMPNENHERVVSFNFDRIKYWLAQDVQVSKPVAELMGLCGFLPIHPTTYMTAWRNRSQKKENAITETDPQNDSSKTKE